MSSAASSGVAEGDAYNPLLVDQAKKRLQTLGLLQGRRHQTPSQARPDRVILDVEVIEQSTGELSFGAGYSTSEGVIGDVSITERNLLGNGQFLRLTLAARSSACRSICRSPSRASLTATFLPASTSSTRRSTRRPVGLQHRRTGGGVRLGFPVSENLWMQTNYTFVA